MTPRAQFEPQLEPHREPPVEAHVEPEAADRPRGAEAETAVPFRELTELLDFELGLLELRLRRQVLRLRAAHRLRDDPFRGLYVSDEQADALLRSGEVGAGTEEPGGSGPGAEGGESNGGGANGGAIAELSARIEAATALRARRRAASRAEHGPAEAPAPLRLQTAFDLDDFDLDVLLLALAPEIDQKYETLFGYVQDDLTRRRPCAQLAFDLLCDSAVEALARRGRLRPGSPLIDQGLVRLRGDTQDPDPPLPGRALHLDPRIADFLLGTDSLDPRLAGAARVLPSAAIPAGTFAAPAARALEGAARLLAAPPVGMAPLVILEGAPGSGRRAAARSLAARSGEIPLLVADARLLLSSTGESRGAGDPGERGALEVLAREARLRGAAVLLERFEVVLDTSTSAASGSGEGEAPAVPRRGEGFPEALAESFETFPLPLMIAVTGGWEPGDLFGARPVARVLLGRAAFDERLKAWGAAFDELAREGKAAGRPGSGAPGPAVPSPEALAEVAGKFALTPGRVRAAARRARDLALAREGEGGEVRAGDLHAGARSQSSRGLARLAVKVETPYRWDDLVVPPRLRQQLQEVRSFIRHRAVVYHRWGFSDRLALGRGANVLFAGPSGTGKTMASSLLAKDLGLDLYRVDLASIISKYIGETEKNLSRVFDEAQGSNAVLFFDECDALFSKRTEVKDAHDRHANVETAYLLQRMEAHDGVVVLATNLRGNLDEAFARRLHHILDFPQPDPEARERLWKKVFPEAAPLAADVDLPFLARQFELTGGGIKNSAVAAAFLAAEEGTPVGMGHLVQAVARELAKGGRLPVRSQFGKYYALLREGPS